jgi:hypothetical protein
MKKIFMCLGAAVLIVSCTTTTKTAKTVDSPASLLSATVADLDVSSERITYTMVPSAEIRRGGVANVKRAAEQEALQNNGNADVLVDAEYVVSKTSYFIFGSKVNSITVSGRPAKYKNFHSLNDSVWCNPVFKSTYKDGTKKGMGSLVNGIFGK